MSSVWLETFLGKTGTYVIRFIDSYYFYLVPVIIAYGIFIALASYNLKRIEKRVSSEIVDQAREIIKQNPGINYADLIDKININWVEIIRSRSFFPYVTHESGLWVNRTNDVNVRDIIMHDHRKIHLILERHGIVLSDDKPAVRRNLYLEYIHRISKK